MSPVPLTGLRAENPLAFLAALGALSLLEAPPADLPAQMSWLPHAGTWIPAVHRTDLSDPADVAEAIVTAHKQRDLAAELGWEKDIMKLTRQEVRELLASRHNNPDAARMVAACLAELPLRRDEVSAPYTPLRLIPRVGRTRFLEAGLRESNAGIASIQSCLFNDWEYVPGTQSMRWDPGARVSSRALMAEAPTHAKPRGVPGAVLLAMRGLSCFPLIQWRPQASRYNSGSPLRVAPPGMRDRNRFVWPVWDIALELPLARMLLSSRWLYELDAVRAVRGQSPAPENATAGNDRREGMERRERMRRARRQARAEAHLRAHGVVARYSAPRVSRGNDDEALGWGTPRFLGEVRG